MSKNNSDPMNAYLAEYNSLRAEILGRMQIQHQAFNYLLIVIGGSITAILTYTHNNDWQSAFWKELPTQSASILFCLALPLVTAPLGFVFFDNEMMIHSIGAHIYWYLRPRVQKATNGSLVFGSNTEFKTLNKFSSRIHHEVSIFRWVFFVVPVIAPTLAVAYCIFHDSKKWVNYFFHGGQESKVISIVCVTLLVCNVRMCLLIMMAVMWSFKKHCNPEEIPHIYQWNGEASASEQMKYLLSLTSGFHTLVNLKGLVIATREEPEKKDIFRREIP